MELRGEVKTVIFRSEDTGYTVLDMRVETSIFTVVGIFPPVSEGQNIRVEGKFQTKTAYGRQFFADKIYLSAPSKVEGIKRFLGSGLIHGLGPVTAEAITGGIQRRGFFTRLGICSILVPIPWETSPPQRFSRKDITAKPTICAQHPATAAPPAIAKPTSPPIPERPRAAHIAAEEMGKVSAIPTTTETTRPITKGCWSIAQLISVPT